MPVRVILAVLAAAALLDAGSPALAAPDGSPCFGAASRDPVHRCRDASLARVVEPMPSKAAAMPNAPCVLHRVAGLSTCGFGTPPAEARGTVALIGDSHAGHWRAAVAAVASAHGWHGVSLTKSSCPLSHATRRLPAWQRRRCARWRRRVAAWLGRHPEVQTVFVSALSSGQGVAVSGGRSEFESAVHGYRTAWAALPRSVRRVIAIRDTPKMLASTARCIEDAVRLGARPGASCARPRVAALDRDPLAAAAARGMPRVSLVDLTRYFCGGACWPVIGGALVFKDPHHMTATYAGTMGPFLDRVVTKLLGGAP